MKLSSLLQEEEMFMSLTCHLTTKKAMHVSLPKPHLVKMEILNEVKVKELRSDNGIEFKNLKLEELCDEKGDIVVIHKVLGNSNRMHKEAEKQFVLVDEPYFP
ncbi:hypothetical protein Tco_0020112 [Tanacetum coccineum]